MTKIVIEMVVDSDDREDLQHVVDRLLDNGVIQDTIAETASDIFGAEIEFQESDCRTSVVP